MSPLRTHLPLFLFFLPLFLQAQRPVAVNFTIKDGLPGMEVYDILQDSHGYLWFATDAGVSRYDGYSFKNYTTADGLPDNTVFGFFEDRHERIWFRTYSGQLAWWKDDTIHRIGANSRILQEQKKNITVSFAIDDHDTIWCGLTSLNGYYKIAPPYGPGNFQLFRYPDNLCSSICVHTVSGKKNFFSYALNAKNEIGLSFFSGDRFVASECNLLPRESDIPKYCTLPDDGHYLCNNVAGVMLSREDTFVMESPVRNCYMAKETRGGLWLGYALNGVWFYPHDDLHKPGLHFLDGLSVTGVASDHEGGVWLSTLENGVYYFPPGQYEYYDQSTGLPDDNITSVSTLNHEIWLGCENGTCCRLGGSPVYSFEAHSAVALKIDSAGPGLFFVSSAYPELFEPATGRILPATGDDRMGMHKIYAFALAPDGKGWGVGNGVIDVFDPLNRHCTREISSPTRFSSIAFDQEGMIWLGGINGLWSFDGIHFQYHGNEDSLLMNRVEQVCFDKKGNMWIATRGAGLLQKSPDGKIQAFDLRNGLVSDICKSVYIDQEGLIWVSANNGISCVSDKNGVVKIHNFGFHNDPLVGVSQVLRVGDTIYAATAKGLIRFDIASVFVPSVHPPVYLSSVEINGKPYRHDTRGASLGYSENSISFSFTGISFRERKNLRYRYRLEGLDTTWHVTSAKEVQYATLPPGKYAFTVYALRSDGSESLRPATWSFEIFPPFWKTWWFNGLSVVIIILLVTAFIRYRIRRERTKASLLTRMAELELTALRSQMNPHFIFNAMNSIQHFILDNDTVSAQKYLSKFSKLMRKILEHSKAKTISLAQELDAIELYIELEIMRSASRFTYEIKIIGKDRQVEKKSATLNISISPMIIQPYIENAIIHGLLPLEDKKGHLLLQLEIQDKYLLCIVDDNGVGRRKAMETKVKWNALHESMGMSITSRRIEMINQHINHSVGVKFSDKFDQAGNPAGTRVEIHVATV